MSSSTKTYIRLMGYVKPYWKVLATSIVLLALFAATEPLFPAMMKPLLDEGFIKKDASFIKWIPYFIVGLFLLRGILNFTSSYASAWVANKVITDMRNAMFRQLLNLPTKFFDNNSSGALTSKIAYDVNNVTGAATQVLTVVVKDSLTIVGLLGWLLWLDWQLTLITLALAPFIAVVVKFFNKRLRILSKNGQLSMAGITHIIEEASTSHKVKVFHGQDYEAERFRIANEKQRGIGMRGTVAAAAVTPIVQIITSISVAIIISIAIHGTNGDTSSAGGFMSYLTAMLMLLAPTKRLTGITVTLQKGLAAAESVFEIIDEQTEQDRGTKTIESVAGQIEFDDVKFNYPDHKNPALSKVSFTINSGETVAMVGRSGSGKSTVVNLLCRFYDLDENSGNITVDNTSINDLTMDNLRSHITYVSQDVRLFNASILENIAYGKPNANPEDVKSALEKAHALEFVEKMPDGLQTIVGENGVKLSGGQRQRLAIARAYFKDAQILILDEATSALDTESEKQVQTALDELRQGKTTIVIAHRLSTIINADRIMVLHDGEIVEQGTHKQLIAQDGQYASLYKVQTSKETD